ncbi:ATP-binding protein [Rapidithrix thailandica]|uniref:histidine kinase n=1 Tax=Rapidithrix thailandica TaxID=413964 RepID=A0AAW9SGV9_9BACT
MTTEYNTNYLRAAFFNKAQESFAIFDKDLNLIDVSEAILDSLQLQREQIIGKNICELSPGIDETEQYSMYRNVIRTGNSIVINNVQLHPKLGGHIARVRAFKLGEGLGLATLNITSLKQAIDELKLARLNLEIANEHLAQKNQELEEFSFIAAHDLKAPLTNLQGLLKVLDAGAVISQEGKPVFEKVQRVVHSMRTKLNTLNDIIALKATLREQKEKVHFGEVFSKIMHEISEQISESVVEIHADFSECPFIHYNPIQLHSVLYNLTINAIKYRHPEKQAFVKVNTCISQGKTLLIVKDNGLGFDEIKDKAKLFRLFKRVHSHVEGLGIGLYIVRSIVYSHGGSIEVNSKINQGTTFKIYLS